MPPTSATAPANFSAGESKSCLTNPMLWNWNTIGVCFISEAWYIDSGALFATTCLAAFGLALFLEFARRASREWERHLFARNVGNPQAFFDPITGIELAPLQPAAAQPAPAQPAPAQPADAQPADAQSAGGQSAGGQSAAAQPAQPAPANGPGNGQDAANRLPPFCPSFVEHIIEASLCTLRLVVTYVLILMAVSFNGYIIICIFSGHFFGTVLFWRDPVAKANKPNVYQRLFQRPIVFGNV
ncbi:copper transport ctr4 [Fusarium sp. NRRL 25303]|nr:copper transport ctr4 [Fusarium sp. NRRL 25303]